MEGVLIFVHCCRDYFVVSLSSVLGWRRRKLASQKTMRKSKTMSKKVL